MRILALALTLSLAGISFAADSSPAYNFPMKTIEGKPTSLKQYHGKVLLLVNVASSCGYTPQYKALEAVYEKYKDQGLVIVGIPANNFANQESGTDAEIHAFCTKKYNVTFPMMSKISVLGADQTPLYHYLTDKSLDPAVRRRYQVELHQVPPRPQWQARRPLRTCRNSGLSAGHSRDRSCPETVMSLYQLKQRPAAPQRGWPFSPISIFSESSSLPIDLTTARP